MSISPFAGKPADPGMLTDIPRLVTAYYAYRPDPAVSAQRVAFGTSGHRGSSLDCAFNEAHILAITQAICLYRQQQGIDGPLFMGIDTHALSEPAFASALEVLAANDVTVMVDADGGYTPTPSRASGRCGRGPVRHRLTVMERAGIRATCAQASDKWAATAADGTGHLWRVTAETPLQAVTDLMDAMGFEDLN